MGCLTLCTLPIYDDVVHIPKDINLTHLLNDDMPCLLKIVTASAAWIVTEGVKQKWKETQYQVAMPMVWGDAQS